VTGVVGRLVRLLPPVPGTCHVCGCTFDRRQYKGGRVVRISSTRSCPKHRWCRAGARAIVDADTPYERDVACQMFVSAFPGGATLDSVSEVLGLSRERVRQIEMDARTKLALLGLGAFGVDQEDPDEQRGWVARHDVTGGDDADEDEAEGGDGADGDGPVDRVELDA